MTKKKVALFFDDGGVISNNNIRGLQWQKLVYQYFYPRYNRGSEEQWAQANHKVVKFEVETLEQLIIEDPLFNYNKIQIEFEIQWVKKMFTEIGIKLPTNEECIKITKDATEWIATKVNASYPGMVEVVNKLSNDYILYTASGEPSYILNYYFTKLGITHNFERLYGPDLINVFKSNSVFYQRILEDTKLNPEQCIVIDDKPNLIHEAISVGMKGIVSNLDNPNREIDLPCFSIAEELEAIIREVIKT